MDTSQYLSLFLEESVENIENLNQSMLELEKEPENISIVNEIFRYAHTLKGMAATMGYNSISELTHSMENILDKLRNNNIKVSTELITVLFQCVDILEKMITNVSEGKDSNIDHSVILAKIASIMEVQPSQNYTRDEKAMVYNRYDVNILKEAKERLYNSYEIEIELRKDCQLKSARAYLIFNSLGQFGEIVKSTPSAQQIENEEFDNTIFLTYLSQREKEFIVNIIEGISEIEYF